MISSYYYTLGPAGNRLSVVEQSGRTVNYTYDALYRLTQEAITDPALGNETIGYTYDDFGNRLTKTDADGTISYTYDANDRMLSEAGPTSIATYTYDDNGNTLSKTEGVDTTLYSYDFENRLVGVNTPAGATAYRYDSDGIRVEKSSGTITTRYLVDKNRDYAQVLEETDNSSLTVSYVYGDDLISQNRGSSYYYLYDGQMSTRKLTDGSGNVANTYTYDAFGIVLDQAGVVANNYMYTGEQYDPNAGFYYLRARYYNQGVGRFVTVDPFEGNTFEPVTLHKYLYASNNPVMYNDPSGEAMTLNEQMTTLATLSVLTYVTYQYCLQNTRVNTRNRDYESEDIVYRGLGKWEHPFAVQIAGIHSKGFTYYSPSEHISEYDRTRDDTGWISTTRSYETARYYAKSGIAAISLDRIPDFQIFDTTILLNNKMLSENAKKSADLDREVLIWLYIPPYAIINVYPAN
ncbi:MAG: RHS repeat-associated core domain-containing protein [Pseudomonadota bacterium]